MKTHAKPCVTGNCLNSAIRIQPRVGKMPLNSAGGKNLLFSEGGTDYETIRVAARYAAVSGGHFAAHHKLYAALLISAGKIIAAFYLTFVFEGCLTY